MLEENDSYNSRVSDIADEPRDFLLPIKGYETKPLVSLEESIAPIAEQVINLEQLVEIAKQNCSNRSYNLPIDQSAAIRLYTMPALEKPAFYFVLNSLLRSKNADRSERLESWFLYLKLLITGLTSIPSYCGTVYRGVNEDLSSRYTDNQTFIWWAFTSCSKSLKVLKSKLFLGNDGPATLFIVECFSGKEIRQYSHFEHEDEVLLVAARQFIVVSRIEARPKFWIIHVKEIMGKFTFLAMDSSISSKLEMICDAETSTDDLRPLFNTVFSSPLPQNTEKTEDTQFYSLPVQSKKLCFINELIPETKSIEIAKTIHDNCMLEILYFSNNNLKDESFRHIIDSLNDRTKLRLLINQNKLTDESAKLLARILSDFPEIFSQLCLDNNRLTSQAVQIILNALSEIPNSSLRTLSFAGNSLINDDCIDSIIDFLNRKPLLRCLYLDRCRFSEDGKTRIQAKAQNLSAFSVQL